MSGASRPTTCAGQLPRPIPAGPGSTTAMACRASKVKELLLHCAENDIRAVMIGVEQSRSLRRGRPQDPAQRPALGAQPYQHDSRRATSSASSAWASCSPRTPTLPLQGAAYAGAAAAAGAARRDRAAAQRCSMPASRSSLATDNVPISLFLPIWQTIARTGYRTKERVAPAAGAQPRRCAALRDRATAPISPSTRTRRARSKPGKLADLAVLSADPLTVEESKIADTRSLMTMVGGRVVHEIPNWHG